MTLQGEAAMHRSVHEMFLRDGTMCLAAVGRSLQSLQRRSSLESGVSDRRVELIGDEDEILSVRCSDELTYNHTNLL